MSACEHCFQNCADSSSSGASARCANTNVATSSASRCCAKRISLYFSVVQVLKLTPKRVLPQLSEEEREQLLTQAHLHTLVEMLEAIPDPRGKHGLRYDLPYLLTCLIAALLCNCQSTEAVSQWCREHLDLLQDLFGPRLFFT